jgi:hypothetical protein
MLQSRCAPVPSDYSQPFVITTPVGNNALSYDRRGDAPSLWVPSLIAGTFDDVRPGVEVVFDEFDEHGIRHACTGLANLVRTTWRGVPTVVMDNHNHAFYFWFEAIALGHVRPGATVIHIDQHRDTRVPERLFEGRSLADAFDYTNFHLNVGNYIVPATRAGMIGDVQFITGASALSDLRYVSRPNRILNIDLDLFAPEMADVDFDLARAFIQAHARDAALITIATSPFFIDQSRAIVALRALASAFPR